MKLLQPRSRTLSTVSLLIEDASSMRPKTRSLPGSFDDLVKVPEVMPTLQDNESGRSNYSAHRTAKAHVPRSAWLSSFSHLVVPSTRSSLAPVLFWTCIILSGTAVLTLLFPARYPSFASAAAGGKGALTLNANALAQSAAFKDTLVLYTFADTDPEYRANLAFFVKHGMWEGDPCDYIIIIQQEEGSEALADLPSLPPNAKYVFHENRCFDWGTFGWAIASGTASTRGYSYFIFMNSSVRGPFLPPYWPVSVHWSRVLVSRLGADVKLVGSTISCETAYRHGDRAQEARANPHVQSYVVATDQEGLKVLRDNGKVFKCYDDIWDTIWYAEVGSSGAILDAGYTIDSLMLRYQGVNWTDTRNWGCNAGLNPYAEFSYDGAALNPLEVLFIKVKSFTLDGEWAAPKQAVQYARWMDAERAPGSINNNAYTSQKYVFRLPRMLTTLLRGPSCFDFEYYRKRSKDLQALPKSHLWPHFINDGQFEGRPFRFTCANPFLEVPAAKKAFEVIVTAFKKAGEEENKKGGAKHPEPDANGQQAAANPDSASAGADPAASTSQPGQ